MALTKTEQAVLAFERDWRRHTDHKQRAIRAAFGFSPARYYQILAKLRESDEAFATDPLTVGRLRRRRRTRQEHARSAGVAGRESR